MRRLLLTLLIALLAASWGHAQSLADVARKEEQRRKQVKKSGKVYTNRDVKPVEPPSAPPAAPNEGTAPAGVGEPPPGSAQKPAAEGSQEQTEEEKRAAEEQQWRARMTEARQQLERSRMFAEALQSRINGLYADFVARDDPAQRAVIERERQKAAAELERVKAEIQTQTKAVADLEEEARRAGVPPGWLR